MHFARHAVELPDFATRPGLGRNLFLRTGVEVGNKLQRIQRDSHMLKTAGAEADTRTDDLKSDEKVAARSCRLHL
jgi:hypothetical protein